MKIQDIELEWLKHSCFKINFKGKNIFIDPFQIQIDEKADLILITHGHHDHCSLPDIEKITKDGTIIICTPDCQSKVTRIQKKIEIIIAEPNKEISLEYIKIKTIPAYNLSKPFHPKSEAWVGYILQLGDTTVYHAGDTDFIKEMQDLVGYGKKGNHLIALLPIGGTYTMDAKEAAKAAALIHPELAVPMHYGAIVGSQEDAQTFIQLCKEKDIDAKVL